MLAEITVCNTCKRETVCNDSARPGHIACIECGSDPRRQQVFGPGTPRPKQVDPLITADRDFLMEEKIRLERENAAMRAFVEMVALDRDDRASPGLKRQASLMLQDLAAGNFNPDKPR